MAITDVKDCVMQITVVTVQEQEKGNVHVGKLVSMLSYKNLSELLFLLASGESTKQPWQLLWGVAEQVNEGAVQWLCTWVVILGTFLCCPLQGNSMK